MLVVKLKGGLGNQLFQYSFGRLLAKLRREDLYLDKDILGSSGDTCRYYGLDQFSIVAKIADREQVAKEKYPFGFFSKLHRVFSTKILRRFHVGYEPDLLKSRASYFEGYFQSYKYIEPIRDELLQDLILRNDFSGVALNILQTMEKTFAVSIHVRRGDYAKPENSQFRTFGLGYYENAVKFFKEKYPDAVFYVFSDDITWVKERFARTGYDFFYVSGRGISDSEELILMSRCQHNIIANSSFSFWGAWLNRNPDKMVIAPREWSKKYKKEYQDLLPGSWLKI